MIFFFKTITHKHTHPLENKQKTTEILWLTVTNININPCQQSSSKYLTDHYAGKLQFTPLMARDQTCVLHIYPESGLIRLKV